MMGIGVEFLIAQIINIVLMLGCLALPVMGVFYLMRMGRSLEEMRKRLARLEHEQGKRKRDEGHYALDDDGELYDLDDDESDAFQQRR